MNVVDITFVCETCGQQLVIDEAGAGTLVDCPHCKKPLLVPDLTEEVITVPVDLPSPKRVPNGNACPSCAEAINRKAIICEHCGCDLVARRVQEAVTMRGQGQDKPENSAVSRTIVGVVAGVLVVGALVLSWPRPTARKSPSIVAPDLTATIPKLATPPRSTAPSKPPQPTKVAQRIYNVEFAVNAPNALTVGLAGEFNNWSSTASPMHKRPDGKWAITLPLPAGRYQYKLIVDGMWIPDPMNPNQADNYSGGKDSVVVIGQ
jgi:DNA-directed RNA polymerase subunit RPC12/RpoP